MSFKNFSSKLDTPANDNLGDKSKDAPATTPPVTQPDEKPPEMGLAPKS